MLQENTLAPTFNLASTDGSSVALSELKGQYVILFFYPKDNTSGCSIEAKDFSDLQEKFAAKQAKVYGISKDSIKSHHNFIEKKDLSIPLLSDPELAMLESYGVWQEKSMYGRKYMGISRTTLLIDPDGKVAKVWEKVKVKGHAQEVLDVLSRLQQ